MGGPGSVRDVLATWLWLSRTKPLRGPHRSRRQHAEGDRSRRSGPSAGRDEQARLSALPVIAEREWHHRELRRPGPIRRLEIGLVPVAEAADRAVIAPVETDVPGRLEEPIRDAGVVLDHE